MSQRPGPGLIIATVSWLLMAACLAWTLTTPDAEKVQILYEQIEAGRTTRLQPAELQMLKRVHKRHPELFKTLLPVISRLPDPEQLVGISLREERP